MHYAHLQPESPLTLLSLKSCKLQPRLAPEKASRCSKQQIFKAVKERHRSAKLPAKTDAYDVASKGQRPAQGSAGRTCISGSAIGIRIVVRQPDNKSLDSSPLPAEPRTYVGSCKAVPRRSFSSTSGGAESSYTADRQALMGLPLAEGHMVELASVPRMYHVSGANIGPILARQGQFCHVSIQQVR